MGSSGTGAVIGGLFLASRRKTIGIKKIIGFCSIIFSICLFVFAFSKNFFLSMTLLVLIGFCFIIINAGSNTAMQAMSPDYLRGRVIGFYSMMFMGMFPLGSLTVGFLAHTYGAGVAVAIGATVCLFVGIYFSFEVRKLTAEAKNLFKAQESTEAVIEHVS